MANRACSKKLIMDMFVTLPQKNATLKGTRKGNYKNTGST